MSIILFLLFFLNILKFNSAGTKDEDARIFPSAGKVNNAINNVREMLNKLHTVVISETHESNTSIHHDLNLLEKDDKRMDLIEELALLRIKCNEAKCNDKTCSMESETTVKKFVNEAKEVFRKCLYHARTDINSDINDLIYEFTKMTEEGREVLKKFSKCTDGWFAEFGMASCLESHGKAVGAFEKTFMEAMEKHKYTHKSLITIRERANQCVDNAIVQFENKINYEVEKAFGCT